MFPVLEVFTILNSKYEGKHLMNLSLKKIKPLTSLLLILTSVVMTFSLLPAVKAQTVITSISPISGHVGTNVTLTANITTPDGQYQILFDENEVLSENATGNNVTVSFTVPHTFEGVHNITIVDVAVGENNTATFTVLTFYSMGPVDLPPSPAQLQENASLTISVNMTGGKSNYTYPKLNVQTPSGNLTYEALKNITTNIVGDFYDNITYPIGFSNGANTNFTGEYKILFNETIVNQFFIGLTNSSKYHRGDIVNIKAVDYPLNENVTITIKFGNETIDSIPFNVTDSIVNVNWPVPSSALIGNYNLSITPVPSSKQNASDTQIFEVPGFQTDIFTRNLANKTVPNIFVRAYDESTKMCYNATSNTGGLASFMLERGNYNYTAFFKEVKVGEITKYNITEETTVNLTCRLTTANIKVVDSQDISVPFVSITITYNYTTNLNVIENRTGTEAGETNITGTLQFHSLLPNITYTINASRSYIPDFRTEVFNQNNNTVYDLPAVAYVDIIIMCPTKRLHVQVIDANNQFAENVTVKAQELMGGLIYTNTTYTDGTADLDCTFGRYTVKVYQGNILLNETTFYLFDNKNATIKCQLLGLYVSIKVVDYLGQPIPNANVTCQRNGLQISSLTGSDGVTAFSNILGGNLQLTVYLPGESHQYIETTSYVDHNSTIEIKIERYVMLAGFLVETGQFTTAMIIVVAIILILSIEIYRRKRLKPQKSVS